MRLLDRYLLRELFTPLAYCLVGIQSFIIFVTVFSDAGKIEEARLHFGETIEYAAAASMEYVPIVLPVALLLALLMSLSHHARYNEITAMRAAGIGLWRICVPYFFVGFIVSCVLFGLNELVVPPCMDWAYQALNRHAEPGNPSRDVVLNFGFTNGRAHRQWVIQGYYHSGSSYMPQPKVEWTLPDGSSRILYADKAVRTNGVWTFFNAHEFSRSDPLALPVLLLRTNVLALPGFDETPGEIAAEIKIANYLSFGAHNPNIPLKDILDYLKWHPDISAADEGRLLTELQQRIATPLTCMVVALIAIPFGAAPGRRNLFFGVAGSIFICFTYFILQRVSLAFGSNGAWPAWLAAWLPNLFFAALGLVLTSRIR